MKLTTEVIPAEIIRAESPAEYYRRLRHDFRQVNQARIHSRLVIPQHGHAILPETHDMSACESATPFPVDLQSLIPSDLQAELGRRMTAAAHHILAAYSDYPDHDHVGSTDDQTQT